jgi:FkbM family methyltransferase
MSWLLASIVCALTVLTMASAAISWRTWRRLRLYRSDVQLYRTELLELATDVGALRRYVSVSHARQLTAAVPGRLPIRCLAQHGEDSLLWDLLGEKLVGYYVEIGAHNGVNLSNTYFFESIGWRGLLVEAHPELAEMCRRARPGSIVVHAALGPPNAGDRTRFSMVQGAHGVDALSFTIANDSHLSRIRREGGEIVEVDVPRTTLSQLLEQEQPQSIDFMTIDVEGAELDVLLGADLERWRPRVLVVEDNSMGSDPRVRDYLQQFGYRRLLRCGCNDIYSLYPDTASSMVGCSTELDSN